MSSSKSGMGWTLGINLFYYSKKWTVSWGLKIILLMQGQFLYGNFTSIDYGLLLLLEKITCM